MNSDQVPDDRSFSGLMERAAAGDGEAMAELCQRYEAKVRIVARVLLGPALRNQFDSVDLLQSVHRSMLVGMRNQKFDISSPEKLIALASTIVRRKVARKWRKARHQSRIESRSQDGSGGLSAMLGSICSPEAAPDKVAEFNDHLDLLCRNMTPAEQTMLKMRLEGSTSAEVAAVLGIHPVALRVRWSRLRARLKEAGVLTDWL